MDRLKAYATEKLGLEPGKPKWLGLQKFLKKDGRFDWGKFIVQQFAWHPIESGVPVVLAIGCTPPTTWVGWLLVAAAILFIRIVHEFVQFSTMPGPEPIFEAVCETDRILAKNRQLHHSGIRVNGRHLNALERAADIFVGGAACWLYVWGGYMLAARVF